MKIIWGDLLNQLDDAGEFNLASRIDNIVDRNQPADIADIVGEIKDTEEIEIVKKFIGA